MKKKTANVRRFMEQLHRFVVDHPQFRKGTGGRSEAQIHAELRPLMIQFLQEYFESKGYKNAKAKASKSFYWEGQEGRYQKEKKSVFGTRNYPDFIIADPFLIAVEYKQSRSGSKVKHGIGQSIMHTLCGEYDFAYLLFHDETTDGKIAASRNRPLETQIIDKMWKEFNVFIEFVHEADS